MKPTTNMTKLLGFLGVTASILVGLGEYYLHYSPQILGNAANYEFFKFVPLTHLSTGHFLAMIGLPFYFAGYLHIYQMLKTGNKRLARITLAIGFTAFAIGGVWIGSRSSIGTIVHLQQSIDATTYQTLLQQYTDHMEVLVQALRVIVAALSVVFVITILKGGTQYRKWMAFCNPITLLLLVFSTLIWAPAISKHVAPIAMNVTHFILFTLSLYQLYKNNQTHD